MKIELCCVFKCSESSNLIFPPMLDVLKIWSRSYGWTAKAVACLEDEININTDADVVAFNVYSNNANSTYRLAKKFRERGKIVIMGGPHLRGPNCKEAFPLCDVAVHSINIELWCKILRNIESGIIEPNMPQALYIEDSEYKFELPDNLSEAYKDHKWYQFPSIFTSLGCPYGCPFCNCYHPGSYKVRNIDRVYKEVSSVKGNLIMFSDASFGMDRKYTMELMEAIAELKKSIMVQMPYGRIHDTALLQSMAKGGIKYFQTGIESFSLSMKKHGQIEEDIIKSMNLSIGKVHDLGMMITGNFVVGLDCDGPEIFEQIYSFYTKSDIDLVIIQILTPYPNTPLYYDLQRNNRLIDDNWDNYDQFNVVFQPHKMTIQQLISGYCELYSKITKPHVTFNKCWDIFTKRGMTAVHGNNGSFRLSNFNQLLPLKLLVASYHLYFMFYEKKRWGNLLNHHKLLNSAN